MDIEKLLLEMSKKRVIFTIFILFEKLAIFKTCLVIYLFLLQFFFVEFYCPDPQ